MSILIVAVAGVVLAAEDDYVISRGRYLRTAADICTIASALRSYHMDNGIYPVGNGEICIIESGISPPYVRFMPRYDAWGTSLRYSSSSDGKSFRLTSAGADRLFEPDGQVPGFAEGVVYSPNAEADIIFEDGTYIQAPPEILTTRPRCQWR
jgi:hypothetical protein